MAFPTPLPDTVRPDVWGTGATWIPSWSSTVIGIGLDASAKLEYISKCICIFKGSEITLVVLSRNEKSTIADSYLVPVLLYRRVLCHGYSQETGNQYTTNQQNLLWIEQITKRTRTFVNEHIERRTIIRFLKIYHQCANDRNVSATTNKSVTCSIPTCNISHQRKLYGPVQQIFSLSALPSSESW